MSGQPSEEEELQSFIAECEWKTRKILRESNKRTKDNANTTAAKERVEKLKHGDSLPRVEEVQVQKSPPPAAAAINKTTTPVKEWKGRDKIISDAYDTIKSFVPPEKQQLKSIIEEGKHHAEETRAEIIHPSLSASPFLSSKSSNSFKGSSKPKKEAGDVASHVGDDDAPAMITRRTIERDFYIMSKQRNKPRSHQRSPAMQQSEVTHELKTEVLWTKYRCDERIMEATKRRTERAQEKMKCLQIPTTADDVSSDLVDVLEGVEVVDSDSTTSSDDDEEYPHAIHSLVEKHIADENARSLKRSIKTMMTPTPVLSVKELWSRFDENSDNTRTLSTCDNVEVNCPASPDDMAVSTSSVPLHMATRKFDLRTAEIDTKDLASHPFVRVDQSLIRHYTSPYNAEQNDAPLSMRISSSVCSPYTSSTICPGHAPVGKRGIWRLWEPLVDDNPDPAFPIWPSSSEIKFPAELDKSQASAFIQYKSLGPQKGQCVTVTQSVAFESPVLAPYVFAEVIGYISPPSSEHELVSGSIPYIHLPCTSLMENPVQSRFDTLLPPPIIVVDPGRTDGDWTDKHHHRGINDFDNDGFRLTTSAKLVVYDNTIPSLVYGISESAMLPSRPMTTPFATHKSYEACTEYLSRERTSDDYRYIAESDGKGTHNEPYLFTTHMSAYKSVFLSRKSISTFREEEHCIRAAKEAERRKLDLALKMKAAEELVEERMREGFEMIEQELVGKGDTSSSAAVPASYPVVDNKSSLELPLPLASNDHASIHEDDELEQLASLLLKNTNFLKALARKLNLPDEQVVNLDATPDASFSSKSADDAKDQAVIETKPAAPVLQQLLASAAPSTKVPKLKLNCKRYRTSVDQVATRGDGWNRLSRSDTIMGDDFSLTKRQTLKGSGQPKFNRLEDNRNFICVNPATEEKYQFDQKHFETTPQSVFIPDLATERLRLAKQYRQRTKMNNETMLTALQQQSMNEILQLSVSNEVPREEVAIGPTGPESDLLNIQLAVTKSVNVVGTEMNARPFDYADQAILAVKTQNLSDLEQFLDTEGVSVETRDQHGNSLLILACQQGSKKLAKFLLKRGADVNSQNNGGNTALHYLHEYKHLSLAEYLLRKGANDSIKNVLLRTCYEGLEASEDE